MSNYDLVKRLESLSKINSFTSNNQKWTNLLEADENFPNGKKLAIRGKDLKSIDQDIFKIDLLLTKLELSPDYQSCLNYKLETVPRAIGNLAHLRELKLDTNELSSVPDELCKLINLERLSLSNNLLKSLPSSLKNLRMLKSLHLSSNFFTEMPSFIFSLDNLSYLDFTSNKLTKLDKNLIKLKKTLRFLSVYDNQIESIDPWIENMKNLDQFWFGRNKIRVIPVELTRIKNLDWQANYISITLDSNPIEKPPISVCRNGFQAIQNWYRENERWSENDRDDKNENSNQQQSFNIY
jgi:Leucine-rich repeat (LRR) protein